MKIRNTIKRLALVGAAAALLPVGGAVAGGPGFDSIAVEMGTTGNLIGCPSGASECNVLITGEGFLQQEVTFDGTVYVQTVIIDPMAVANGSGNTDIGTLPFSDITFIRMDGSSTGIKGLQTLSDDPNDGTGNLFTGTTELLIGSWAAEAGKANLNVVQDFRDNGGTGVAIGANGASQTEDDFVNTFSMGVNLASDGSVTGKQMDMLQDIGMSDPTVTVPGNDFQRFVIRQRSGDLLTTTGSLVLEPVAGSAGTGGTVSWVAADDMMVAWLGQRVGLGDVGVSNFGFQSATNAADPANPDIASTFSRTVTDIMDPEGPFDWDASFGTAPAL